MIETLLVSRLAASPCYKGKGIKTLQQNRTMHTETVHIFYLTNNPWTVK